MVWSITSARCYVEGGVKSTKAREAVNESKRYDPSSCGRGNHMKYLVGGLLACLFLGNPRALSQTRAMRTSIIELMASPERFDKKFVEVTAFLKFEFLLPVDLPQVSGQ